MHRPLIGITSFKTEDQYPIFKLNADYVEAVYKAGGIPVIMPQTTDLEVCKKFAETLDGLIIPGGADVSPMFYGEQPVKEVTYIRADNDRFEFEILKLCLEAKKPILGICRGMQLINVAFGGTLWQDIPSQIPDAMGHLQDSSLRNEPFHTVNLEEGSRIAKIVGADSVDTTTYHHQCIKDLAEGLKVTGKTSDGIIEVVEGTESDIIAVQWHPEGLACKNEGILNLFKTLVESAGK